MHGAAGRELAVGGDTRLNVDEPEIRCEFVENRQRVAPRPREVDWFGDRAVDLLGNLHVGPGVIDDWLPQRGIDVMRKYLVDAATCHHIAAQEKGRTRRHTSRVHREPSADDMW